MARSKYGKRKAKESDKTSESNGQWSTLDTQNLSNQAMEAYYRAQQIFPSEDDFRKHFDALKRPLPLTLRLTGSRESVVMMRDYMERVFIPYLSDKTFEGNPLSPPVPIGWYPDSLAYMLDIPKRAIRKNPEFKAFQQFLVMESDSGNIVRQEAVSMIPPLLMNIEADSTCFDMCAAPGSKTSQMVEYLHNFGVPDPSGFVLANDSDFKRAYMLVHQVKRLNSPSFIVTNHDATFIPNFHTNEGQSVQAFDRVLADVPCSGDGTLRKNLDIWKKWSVSAGLSLHATQVNCLRRGLQILKTGGRLVYSTCSLNPIEDEAVLSAVLSSLNGAAHLVDVSAQLPGLLRHPGLQTWKVTDFAGKFVESLDDVEKEKHKFPTTVFPPSPSVAKVLNLERSMRIYPHLQDTGGFFVAVIEKTRDIKGDFESVRRRGKRAKTEDEHLPPSSRQKLGPSASDSPSTMLESAKEPTKPESKQDLDIDETDLDTSGRLLEPVPGSVEVVIPKPKFMKSLNDEYFKFLPPDHPELLDISRAYGLSSKLAMDCFLSRNATGEPVRSLYYTSPEVKNLLVNNENRIKFVHAGIKVFHRQGIENLHDGSPESEGMCKWRIAQDGVELLKDHVSSEKVVTCNLKELTVFMQHEFPRVSLFDEEEGSVIQQLKGKTYGCYILCCDLSKDSRSRIPEVISVPLWKSKQTIQMMVARKDKEAIYTRATGKTLPPAIKVNRKESANIGVEDTNPEHTSEIIAEDQLEAAGIAIADACATEEEGRATSSTLQG